MNITLNGKSYSTRSKTVFELCESIENKVIIKNGYQLSENSPLNENDEIFIISKGKLPAQNQLEAMMSARHTPHIQQKIKGASVAICGLGGLGSSIAMMLCRLGVGKLLLIDFDIVEPSNLNRQQYYISHLGKPKTDSLSEQLRLINPYIEVKTLWTRLNAENIPQLLAGYDIICEAFDNPQCKAELVSTVLEAFPQSYVVSASGMAGYDSSNKITTVRRTKSLYVCGDGENAACVGNGLMSPRVQICAGHQANMILRLILGICEP